MVICPNCKATGQLRGPRWLPPADQVIKPCPTCKGSGRVHHKLVRWGVCPSCEGWGNQPPLIDGSLCSMCEGVGMVEQYTSRVVNWN
jgi:DnaJ-class molecular chaperone